MGICRSSSSRIQDIGASYYWKVLGSSKQSKVATAAGKLGYNPKPLNPKPLGFRV